MESSGATIDDADEVSETVSRRPVRGAPFAGIRVSVTGSSRTTIVTTDREGIYDVADLPPDNYTLKMIDLPDTQYAVDRGVEKEWLKRSGLIEVDFRVDWNGTIEGRVRDVAGGAAHVSLELQNPDGWPRRVSD